MGHEQHISERLQHDLQSFKISQFAQPVDIKFMNKDSRRLHVPVLTTKIAQKLFKKAKQVTKQKIVKE